MLVRSLEKALERAIDQPGVFLRQLLVREAELVERAGTEVFGQDISAAQQSADDFLSFDFLKVEREALLVAVEDREKTCAGSFQPAGVVAGERLDLDHFGAEIGKHQPAGRAHHHVRELDDAHPVKGKYSVLLQHEILLERPPGRNDRRSAPAEWRPP